MSKNLEDTITHLLSEWLNDSAPIGENRYREPAKAAIKEILEFVEKAGCPHACAPPCPFNRKMASLRTQHVTEKDGK